MFHHVNVIAVAINTCFNFIHEDFCIQIFQNLPLNGGQLPVERERPPGISHTISSTLPLAITKCPLVVMELPDVLYKWTFLLRIHGFGLKSWEGRQPPMSKSMLSLLQGKPRLELELHLQPPHFWCQTSHDVNMKSTSRFRKWAPLVLPPFSPSSASFSLLISWQFKAAVPR